VRWTVEEENTALDRRAWYRKDIGLVGGGWSFEGGRLRRGGIISREIRVGTERVGFEKLDLKSEKKGWLARVDI
jgi:hypothetical protein